MNIAVVLAGGVGSRTYQDIPKQYLLVNGKEVISYPISALKQTIGIGKIIVAADEKYHDGLVSKYGVDVCGAGANRNQTVYSALQYIRANYSCDNIVFVDSARVFLTSKAVEDILKLLETYKAVITCSAITDSLGKNEIGVIDRSDYFLVQTPEAFHFDLLNEFRSDSDRTAIIQQVTTNNVGKYYGLKNNIKITYYEDLKIVDAILKTRE